MATLGGHAALLTGRGRMPRRHVALALCTLGIATAVALLPLTASAALVLGVSLALLILARPAVGLAALALTVPFGSLFEVQVSGIAITADEPLVGILVLSWAMMLLARRQRVVYLPCSIWSTALILGVLAFDLTLVPTLALAVKELIRWGELSAVALIGCNVLHNRRQIVTVLAVILVAGLAEAFVGWYQFLLRVGPPAFAVGRFLRAYGSFNQPNPFAGYLGMVWPLGMSLALYWLVASLRHATPSREPRVTGLRSLACRERPHAAASALAIQHDTPAARFVERLRGGGKLGVAVPGLLGLLALLATAVIAIAMLMSYSRGAWLGLVVATMLLAGLYQRRLFALLLLAAALVVALVALGQFNLLPAAVAARVNDAIAYFRIFDVRTVQATPQNWAVVERMASWQAAWRMFEVAPLLGIGPGHYDLAYARYGMEGWPQPLGHAHNYYLNVLAEMGALGLAAYLLSLGTWLVAGLFCFRRLGSSPMLAGLSLERAVVAGVLGALAAAAVHNVFDNLYVHGMNIHVGLLLGIMLAVGRGVPGAAHCQELPRRANLQGGQLP